ncbi:MAG: hypothetical protein IKS62_00810 [Aeriscardovia sp.]|nr:hypothetical protein [Aeriscardovia sp.]
MPGISIRDLLLGAANRRDQPSSLPKKHGFDSHGFLGMTGPFAIRASNMFWVVLLHCRAVTDLPWGKSSAAAQNLSARFAPRFR